jgi:hypothetical protein
MLGNYIRQFDLLGSKPTFLIQKEVTFKTVIGGILSTIMFILALTMFFILGKELFLLRNPESNYVEKIENSPRQFNIDFQNFNLYIGIEDKNGVFYYDYQIYTLEAFRFVSYPNSTKIMTPLPLVKCTLEAFNPVNKEIYLQSNPPAVWCLNSTEIKNLSIKGTFGNDFFSGLTFTLSQCRNSTISKNCKSQEEINKLLLSAKFSIKYFDYAIDEKNFVSPFTKTLTNEYFLVSSSYYKELTLFLRNVDIFSDIGFIFESFKIQSSIRTDKIIEQTDFRNDYKYFCKFTIRLSTAYDVTYRKYLKIQTLIAQLGGLYKFFLVFTKFLYGYINRNFMFIFLMQKLNQEMQSGGNSCKSPSFKLQNAERNRNADTNFFPIDNKWSSMSIIKEDGVEERENKINNFLKKINDIGNFDTKRKVFVFKNYSLKDIIYSAIFFCKHKSYKFLSQRNILAKKLDFTKIILYENKIERIEEKLSNMGFEMPL